MRPWEQRMKWKFKCYSGPRKYISINWIQPTGTAACMPIRHAIFLVPKSPAHSCHRCWLIPSTVSLLRGFVLRHVHLRKPSFGHTTMAIWIMGLGVALPEVRTRRGVVVSHSSVDTSPCLFLLHPGPPVEGSEQHREKEGKHSGPRGREARGTGETRLALPRRAMFGGSPAALSWRQDLRDRPSVTWNPTGTEWFPLFILWVQEKNLTGWHAANIAEAVLGSEPAAGNDIQADLIILFSQQLFFHDYLWQLLLAFPLG